MLNTQIIKAAIGAQTHSKLVQSGDVFLAVPCSSVQQHIQEAMERGAELVIADEETLKTITIDYGRYPTNIVRFSDIRLLMSLAAHLAFPEQPKTCVAVTGTNGKSSIVDFYRQIALLLGEKAISIGTLGILGEDSSKNFSKNFSWTKEFEHLSSLTTPSPMDLHKILHTAFQHNITHAALEASSHGLEQKRLHQVSLQAGAFVNLTHDHLDYHKTMESYYTAKKRLFSEILKEGAYAIISTTLPFLEDVLSVCEERSLNIITCGFEGNIIVKKNINKTINIIIDNEIYKDINWKIHGQFQLQNLECVLGLCLASSMNMKKVIETLPYLKAPLGRMQEVAPSIFVDFAHTPDALERALISLQKSLQDSHKEDGRIIVVFGCGGDRDQHKRPIMGKIAYQYADVIIITDDNPRFEDALKIRNQIQEGIDLSEINLSKSSHKIILEIDGRKNAILEALKMKREQDIVLIAGKGHEQGQIIQGVTHPFQDQAIVREFFYSRTT